MVACGGSKDSDSTGTPGGNTAGGNTAGGAAGGTTTAGWSMSGTVLDFDSGAPAAEGLCIDLLDPSPALTGGESELLLSGTVGKGGTFQLDGIVTSSVLGLLASVKDCGTENTTVFTSANGVAYADIQLLQSGDSLDGLVFRSIDLTTLADMQSSAEALGYTGTLLTEGFLLGMLQDQNGSPVDGATFSCAECGPTWYHDDDATDGRFATGAVPNPSSVAAGQAAAIIAAAPVAQYSTEDGGKHYWAIDLFGSNPSSALIAPILAD